MRLDEAECEDGIHIHLGLFNGMTYRILKKKQAKGSQTEMLE